MKTEKQIEIKAKEKAIANCVKKEKVINVRIELKNGNTVRVSAHAVKNLPIRGQIDVFNVNKDDRKLLDKIKNSTTIEKPIAARDIKRITHGRHVLFEV